MITIMCSYAHISRKLDLSSRETQRCGLGMGKLDCDGVLDRLELGAVRRALKSALAKAFGASKNVLSRSAIFARKKCCGLIR